jgi:hypothetical protein
MPQTAVKRTKQISGRTKQRSSPEPLRPVSEYRSFQTAFEIFTAQLFDCSLNPSTIQITLVRKANTRGYFIPNKFAPRTPGGEPVDEIALNPDCFHGRSDYDILGDFAQLMVHKWQKDHGKPSRRGYHNAQFAEKMKSIGLYPSSTGARDGKETGAKMMHYVIPGGPFDLVCQNLLKSGFELHWQSILADRQEAQRKLKTTFTCPDCGQKGYGPPTGAYRCDKCPHTPQMLAATR